MAHASRNWQAVELSDLIGSKHELAVTGEVEVMGTDQVPKLIPARTGIGEALLLDLKVESDGSLPGHVVTWRPVEYRETIKHGRYHEVDVRRGPDDVQRLKVGQAPA